MADNTSVFDATSTAGSPRSVRDQELIGTPQTPVASPYYNDGRNVTPVVYTYDPVLPTP
jgi:hypothetical protein